MKLTIIGASGHGKVVADIAKHCGYDEIEFLDDNKNLFLCGAYPVVGRSEIAKGIDNDIVVGIGNANIRKRIMKELDEKRLVTLVHPNAVISEDVVIGKGSVVMAGVVINSGTRIGEGVIVNTCSSIDHDCVIHSFAHIAVGAHLCGTVTVGTETWIGAGSTVSNNVKICDKCIIGAGAVVIKNIEKAGTYVGVPARSINQFD